MALRTTLFLAFLTCAAPVAWSAGPSNAQEKGAEAFIAAVAGGNAQTIAQEIHPDELDKLRGRLLTLLRAEASRSDNTYRSRLFGPGRSLADLESMTAVRFYAALSDRLRLRARQFQKFDWLAAIPSDKVVYLMGFGIPPKDRGAVKVAVTVGLMQYGSLWKAAIPTEIEAQIDDLLEGRAAPGAAPAAAAGGAADGAGVVAVFVEFVSIGRSERYASKSDVLYPPAAPADIIEPVWSPALRFGPHTARPQCHLSRSVSCGTCRAAGPRRG